MRKTTIAAAIAATLVSTAAYAQAHTNLQVVNGSQDPVWVSVYSATKERWDTTCIEPGRDYVLGWSVGSWNGTQGGLYIRAEYKTGPACTGSTFRDTGMGQLIRRPDSGNIVHFIG